MIQDDHAGGVVHVVGFLVDDDQPAPIEIFDVVAEYLGVQGCAQKEQGVGFSDLQCGLCHPLAVHHLAEEGYQGTHGDVAVLAQRDCALGILYIFQRVCLLAAGAVVVVDGAVEVDHVLAAASAGDIVNVAGDGAVEMAVLL